MYYIIYSNYVYIYIYLDTSRYILDMGRVVWKFGFPESIAWSFHWNGKAVSFIRLHSNPTGVAPSKTLKGTSRSQNTNIGINENIKQLKWHEKDCFKTKFTPQTIPTSKKIIAPSSKVPRKRSKRHTPQVTARGQDMLTIRCELRGIKATLSAQQGRHGHVLAHLRPRPGAGFHQHGDFTLVEPIKIGM